MRRGKERKYNKSLFMRAEGGWMKSDLPQEMYIRQSGEVSDRS